VRSVAREALATALSAVVAALLFLIMVQGSFRQGYTDLDFNHVLGTLVKGTAEEETGTTDAFGVIGDTAGPTGLYATLGAAAVLMAFHGLVLRRLVKRGWPIQGLALGVLTFLVVGFGFGGVAEARLDTPTGLFGVDAGGLTPLVLGIPSLVFGLVGVRCYELVANAAWWEERETDLVAAIESVAELEEPDESLELPEEGPEERRVGA
jgi:hypothetical protein